MLEGDFAKAESACDTIHTDLVAIYALSAGRMTAKRKVS